jgi:hypothetical protein
MVKHSPSISVAKDPYCFLVLTLLEDAFRTIECYYRRKGTKEEIAEGRNAISWIRKMEGTFRLTAMASNINIESFHQMCMWKINDIRREALKSRYEKTGVVGKNKQGKVCRTKHLQLGQAIA